MGVVLEAEVDGLGEAGILRGGELGLSLLQLLSLTGSFLDEIADVVEAHWLDD